MMRIIEEYLDDKEFAEFSKWAFGKDYEKLKYFQLVNSWNKNHSKLYEIPLDKNLNFRDIVPKMISLWIKSKNLSK